MDQITQNEIIAKYKSGYSIKKLGREYKLAPLTIKRYLLLNNIPIEFRSNGRRKFNLLHNYFEFIDNPKKAYLLGFLFADGYVLNDGYVSGITLARPDRIILEELSREVYGSDLPVYDIKKMQTNKIPQSRVLFKSREFQKHLIDKNLLHNKSLILTPPHNIPDNLIKYFILGYFDGDGCFSAPTLSIVSTQIFCEWIGKYLMDNEIISHYKLAIADNGVTHRLLIWRKADIASIYNYFYNDPALSLFLDRKRRKMFEYLNK